MEDTQGNKERAERGVGRMNDETTNVKINDSNEKRRIISPTPPQSDRETAQISCDFPPFFPPFFSGASDFYEDKGISLESTKRGGKDERQAAVPSEYWGGLLLER